MASRYCSHDCSSCSDHCCSSSGHHPCSSHSGCSCSSHAKSDDGFATFNGNAQLHHRTFANLIVNGAAMVEKIVVKDKFVVNGALNADKLEGNNLRVNGAAVLKDSSLAGLTSISGVLQAEKTNFADILLSSEVGEFTTCTIKKITVRPVEHVKTQKIVLSTSTVEGDIIFEKEGGQVILKDGAKLIGAVVGGTLQKH